MKAEQLARLAEDVSRLLRRQGQKLTVQQWKAEAFAVAAKNRRARAAMEASDGTS